MEPLSAPIQPPRGYRNTDKYGSGAFLASRDNGSRPHLGVDVVCLPGDSVFSPIEGEIDHIGLCYPNDAYLKLLTISGMGKHAGIKVRLLYVDPKVTLGQHVKAAQVIGVAQNIGARDVGITPHVHFEVWVAQNPADMLPRYTP